MIKLLYEGVALQPSPGPFFYCDQCEQRIEDLEAAMAIFDEEYELGKEATVRHVHAGDCYASAADSFFGTKYSWTKLSDHLEALRLNYSRRS